MASIIPNLATCTKIGFIVPSSNTLVEPTCNAIAHSLNSSTISSANKQILCLYTRISVHTLGTDAASTSQFATSRMVDAARLLADAECAAILWNGTSGMWTGASLADDEALAHAMSEATGVPCSTTTLATVAALRALGARRLGVAVPYDEALMGKVVEFFEGVGDEGWRVVRAERMAVTPKGGNLGIGKVGVEEVREVVLRACEELEGRGVPEAVVVACTNWRGAELAREVEERGEGRMVLVDSITVTVWMALRMIGWKGGAEGWGRLLERV